MSNYYTKAEVDNKFKNIVYSGDPGVIKIPSALSVSRINVEGTYNIMTNYSRDEFTSFKYRTDFSIIWNINAIKFCFLDSVDQKAFMNGGGDNYSGLMGIDDNELLYGVNEESESTWKYTLYANGRIDKIMVRDRYNSDFYD